MFAELYWDPGHIKQAEDRAHRIGQCSSVNIHFLIAKGTMDTLMWAMLNRKVGVPWGQASELQYHKSLVQLQHSLRQMDTPAIAYHQNVTVCSDLVFSSFLLFIQDAKIMSFCQGEWDGSYPQEMVVYLLALYCCCCSVYNFKAFRHSAHS